MRYTVLTYIFAGYEIVQEIEVKDPEAEYILVTDDPNLKSDTWTVIHENLPGHSAFGKCYEVRHHPFRYAHTDIVVRVDGSIKITGSLKPLIDEFERGRYDRCMMIHPRRNTMPEEYETWVRFRRYPRSQATRCLTAMKLAGYDMEYRGLYQGCFEILRKNQINLDINDQTFSTLWMLGAPGQIERIDQTVWSFVINRYYQNLKVMAVSESIITASSVMQWRKHRTTIPVPDAEDKIKPYLFNRPCKIWTVNPKPANNR